MITDNITAALDKADIEWHKYGDADEGYPFYVLLEKAQTANVNGFWRQRYNLHLVFDEDDDCDALERKVLDALWDNADCYVIDDVSPLQQNDDLEAEVITIRVVIYA